MRHNGSVVVLTMLLLSGCVATTLEHPAELASRESVPRRVRVIVVGDSVEQEVGNVTVARDSMFGVIIGSAAPGYPLHQFAEPLESLQRVRVTRFDPITTMAAPAAWVAAVALSAWILSE